jgi:hypothetical protein
MRCDFLDLPRARYQRAMGSIWPLPVNMSPVQGFVPSKETGVVVENVVPADAAGTVVQMSTLPMISVTKAKLASRNLPRASIEPFRLPQLTKRTLEAHIPRSARGPTAEFTNRALPTTTSFDRRAERDEGFLTRRRSGGLSRSISPTCRGVGTQLPEIRSEGLSYRHNRGLGRLPGLHAPRLAE